MDTLLAALSAASAGGLALAMAPWRALGPEGPPWPWLAWATAMPALWGAAHLSGMAVAQPLSGACLLMLMCGWPLAVLLMVPVAVGTAFLSGLTWPEALQAYLWQGLLPASLGALAGALVRRSLPNHLMVYILGRGFFATALAGSLAGALATAVQGPPPGLAWEDVVLGRSLAAWGDAWLSGILVSIFVAFRPQWLATYADRIYLPAKPEA